MRTIVQEGHEVLRGKARDIPVADITSPRIRELVADMKSLLAKEEYGVAIAAPQVGEPLRLFIVAGKATAKRSKSNRKRNKEDNADEDDMPKEDQVYINPELLKISRAKSPKHEGCLSIRGQWGVVPRAEKATVRAYNEHGQVFTRGASGFLAHVFQHELDHLEGILYIDKATEIYDDSSTDSTSSRRAHSEQPDQHEE